MAMYQRPRARRGAADLQNEVDGTTRVTTQDERLAEARQALHSAYSTLQSGNPVQALQVCSVICRVPKLAIVISSHRAGLFKVV